MAQEDRLHELLNDVGFANTDHNCLIMHPTVPGSSLEVDNLAQKGAVAFVFEGKKNDPEKAKSQLIERHNALIVHKREIISSKILANYSKIRLFYYSLKSKQIIEYDSDGGKLSDTKFNDEGVLREILRNL